MKCSIEGCDSLAKYAGLCGMHYKRVWRHGANKTLSPTRGFIRSKCKVEDCNETSCYSIGYCELHYQRWNRYGRTHNIVNIGSGYTISSAGYVLLYRKGKWISEHTILAEKALGKPLPKGAVVHHTGKPWDNYGPFKLVICLDQAYHLLLHRRMRELQCR